MYVNGPEGASLRIFDRDGVSLAVHTVPVFAERSSCLSIATDPAGGWWLTAVQDPANGTVGGSSLHRLPHRDSAFTSTSTALDQGGLLSSVVSISGGVMLGGSREPVSGLARTAVAVTFDEDLGQVRRWSSDELGHISRLESLNGVPIALAPEPTIDYGDAFLLSFEDPGGPPTWKRDAGTLGDRFDAILSFATAGDLVLLLKTSREVVPGSAPYVPGDLSTLPPQQARSVVEARDASGAIVWAHEVVDDHVGVGSVAGDDEVILAWRGALDHSFEPARTDLSVFEVLNTDGDCTCAVESPFDGRILDISPLPGAPTGSFIIASQHEQTFEITRVRVDQP